MRPLFLLIPAARAEFTSGAANAVPLPGAPLPLLILWVINTVLVLAGVVALGFLVYGGFKYITARGDEQETTEAKQTITGAVIGLVVIGIAAAIVNFVISTVL